MWVFRRKKRSLLGMRRVPRKKMSVTKAMLSISAASLGVSSSSDSISLAAVENNVNNNNGQYQKISLCQKLSSTSGAFEKIQEVDETTSATESRHASFDEQQPSDHQALLMRSSEQRIVRFDKDDSERGSLMMMRHMDSCGTADEEGSPMENTNKK